MAVRDPGARTTSIAQDLARPFFSRGFFRVSLEGPSERGTTRSLQVPTKSAVFMIKSPVQLDNNH